MKKIIFLFLVTIITVSDIPSSFAAFEVTPSLEVQEKYNDNIFLRRSDREDDFITILNPNININYTSNKLDLNLDYGFEFRFFSDHDELNDTSLKDTQFTSLKAQARPLDRVFIDIRDRYTRVPIDIRNNTAPDNEFENMTQSNIFMISPYIMVPITSTVLLQSGYTYSNVWYDDEEGNDANNNGAFVSITHRYPRGLSISLNYNYLAHRPGITSEANIHTGTIEAKYQLMRHLSLLGRGGKSYIDFLDTSNEKFSNWNIEAEYGISSTEDSMIMIIAKYENNLSNLALDPLGDTAIALLSSDKGISATTGLTNIRRFDFGFMSRKKDVVKSREHAVFINCYNIISDEIETEREDEITGFLVELKKSLTSRLTNMADFVLERQKFLPEDIKVKWYSVGYGIDYLLGRSVTAGIRYTYNNRNSEIDEGDYHNNIYTIKARFIF